MLKKYNHFKEDFLLESINESVIYFSPNFRKLLSKIEDNDIAKDLLEVEVTDIKPDVTFIDLDPEKDDYLSFTTMRNAIKVIDPGYLHLKELENEPIDTDQFSDKESRISLINQMYSHHNLSNIFKKSRNPLRIGKFVNKVLGTTKYNSTQVEEFVNKLKSSKEQSEEKFLIVEGDDISFWYKSENYAEIKGQLGNSCMKEKPSSFFEIYVKNPEVCRMLVLLEDDKLIGRALIWKLSLVESYGKNLEGLIYFMDRQYTLKESDVDKFRAYALENDWAYKSNNNYSSVKIITYKEQTFSCNMRVGVKDLPYNMYPYMDTFRRYSRINDVLFNDDENTIEHAGDYILNQTNGSYDVIEDGVYSEFLDRMIPEDYAVWSDWADSYLDSDNAIRVVDGVRGNHGWYPDGCEDLVYDDFGSFWLHLDDSVYSEVYGFHFDISNAVEVIDDIDKNDGEPMNYEANYYHVDDSRLIYLGGTILRTTWFKRLSEKWSAWTDYSYVNKSLFTKNYNDMLILSVFETVVYTVIDNDEIEYLSKLDAKTLGISIEESNETIMDKFEYHESIEDILPELKSELDSKLKSINDTIEGKGQLTIPFEDDENYKLGLKQRASNIEKRISEIEGGLFIDFEED